MQMQLPPLLITSAITIADQQPVIGDPDERLRLTLVAIGKWLELAPEIQMVICDGSNFDLSTIMRTHFPQAKIECLHFQNDAALVAKLGKGYGEGEIINYALDHSKHLQAASFFIKCTSKVWIKNFSACLRYWDGRFICNADFSNVTKFKPYTLNHIDTRFFIVDKAFYRETFAQAYLQVNDPLRQTIEQCFKKIVLEKKLQEFILPIWPALAGFAGSTGEDYELSRLGIWKEDFKRMVLRWRSPLVAHK